MASAAAQAAQTRASAGELVSARPPVRFRASFTRRRSVTQSLEDAVALLMADALRDRLPPRPFEMGPDAIGSLFIEDDDVNRRYKFKQVGDVGLVLRGAS